jgi:glucose-1-phosphate thymidylyltransferase
VVGLVPAAGSATRLGPLPCSKEVLPLPAAADAVAGEAARAVVRPAMAHLLDGFAQGGVARAFVVVRDDKWDVPRALRQLDCGVDLAYVVVGETPSPVHSLARAVPFVRDQVVALGFPDILFAPHDAYGPLLERLLAGTADVVLGLFPTEQHEKTDMVELADDELAGDDGAVAVRDLVIKQPSRGLRYTWSIACWRPRFTEVLAKAATAAPHAALHVGDVIRTAIARRLRVEGVPFDDGSYLDIGTPEDLVRAMSRRP